MEFYKDDGNFERVIEAIRNLNEIVHGKKCKEKNTGFQNEILDIIRKLAEIYSDDKVTGSIETKVKELAGQFGDLSKITDGDGFLKASRQFDNMFSKIYETIYDSIKSD